MKRLLTFTFCFVLLTVSLNSRAQFAERHPDLKYFETYLQYAPYAMDIGMEFAGAETETLWYERLIKAGVSIAVTQILSSSLKAIVKEDRPDGMDDKSFPSGHTATAFAGAELVRQNYGWGWGAGAYAAATTVGVLRVVHNRHNWWDALAGAGIGILSAQIGKWTLKPIENLFGINPGKDVQLSIMPYTDPITGAYGAGTVIRF